jgi:lysophospholipase
MKNLIFILVFVSLNAFAIPEENYIQNWHDKVFPHFGTLSTGDIQNAQGLHIRFHYTMKSSATKTILILPGRSEPAMKYAELVYDLDSPEVNIFVLDHQGQGESDRVLPDTQKGHVVNFQDYVNDVALFMKKIVLREARNTQLLLLAHSMGGPIGVHYLAQNPNVFQKAFLNAPMLKINTKPYAEIIAKIYSMFLIKTGKKNEYAPGKGPYVLDEDTFEKNAVTHSEVRFETNKGLFRDFPYLIVGGPTVNWVYTSLKATAKIQYLGPKINIPIFMLQSGHDEYVKNDRLDSFCTKARDCKKVLYPQAFHEILQEKDEIRNDALNHIRKFFDLK